MGSYQDIHKPGESSALRPYHSPVAPAPAPEPESEADQSTLSRSYCQDSDDEGYYDGDDDGQMLESDLNDIETSMRLSKSIDDIARLITEFRQERKRRSFTSQSHSPRQQRHSRQLEVPSGTPSSSAFLEPLLRKDSATSARRKSARRHSRSLSQAGSEGAGGSPRRSIDGQSDAMSVGTSRRNSWKPISRCTCCCGREGCERAVRAMTEWADMEQDLKLAAEIGQALLRRNDVLSESTAAQEARHTSQVESLMRRLTKTIKESDAAVKELDQTCLNLEAADSSNRALLSELEECRRELSKVKTDRARLVAMEERSHKISKWLEDARQEVQVERRKTAAAEAKAKRSAEKVANLSESIKQTASSSKSEAKHMEALMKARTRLREETLTASSESSQAQQEEILQVLEGLAMENEALQRQVEQTTFLLQAANEDLSTLRETDSGRPSHTRTISRRHKSYGFSDAYRGPSTSLTQPRGQAESEEGDEDLYARLPVSPQPVTSNLAEELIAEGEGLYPNQQIARRSLSMPPRAPSRASAASSSALEGQSLDQRFSPRLPHALLLSPNLPQNELPPVSGRTTPMSTSEAQRIRAAYLAASSDAPSSSSTTAVEDSVSSGRPTAQTTKRESRTTQLAPLLDYTQRLVARLGNADVETMGKRLQRQHLTGDVGHLSRVTINAITREADGMREHFRKLIDSEARSTQVHGSGKDDSSLHSAGEPSITSETSLVARKEFFALIKLLRDVIFEAAKLRNVINELQLTPTNAAKILQEHLGAPSAQEDKGVGAWIGGLLRGVAGAAAVPAAAVGPSSSKAAVSPAASPSVNADGAASGGLAVAGKPPVLVRAVSRGAGSASTSAMPVPPRPASRASAAVLSSAVAVEVKGTRASTGVSHTLVMDPSGLDEQSPLYSPAWRDRAEAVTRPKAGRAVTGGLSRIQSRNLSGLFAGAPVDGWTVVTPRLSAVPARHGGHYLQSQPSTPGFAGASKGKQGGQGTTHRPLSRIVDDDEVSIRQSKPQWGSPWGEVDSDNRTDKAVTRGATIRGLRPRGLSDSSIRSTFLEHETDLNSAINSSNGRSGKGSVGLGLALATADNKRASPAARIINRSTLALQPAAVIDSSKESDASTLRQGDQGSAVERQRQPQQQQQRPRGVGGSFFAGLGSTLGLTRQPSNGALFRSAAASASATAPLLKQQQDMLDVPAPAAIITTATTTTASAMAVPGSRAVAGKGMERRGSTLATSPLLSPYGTSPAAAAMVAALSPRTSRTNNGGSRSPLPSTSPSSSTTAVVVMTSKGSVSGDGNGASVSGSGSDKCQMKADGGGAAAGDPSSSPSEQYRERGRVRGSDREKENDMDHHGDYDGDRPLASVLAYSRMMGGGGTKWSGE